MNDLPLGSGFITSSFDRLVDIDRQFCKHEESLYKGDFLTLSELRHENVKQICLDIMNATVQVMNEYKTVNDLNPDKAFKILSVLKRLETRLVEPKEWNTEKIINAVQGLLSDKKEKELKEKEKELQSMFRRDAYTLCKTATEYFKTLISSEAKARHKKDNSHRFFTLVHEVAESLGFQISKVEKFFFKKVAKHFSNSDELEMEYVLFQMLKGGHVLIADDGKLYDLMSKKEGYNIPRISSHYKDIKPSSPQYAIRGDFVKEILYGKVEKNGKTYTWFQFEANPVKGLSKESFKHIFSDYVEYKITGRNVGPGGTSIHSENFCPLILE